MGSSVYRLGALSLFLMEGPFYALKHSLMFASKHKLHFPANAWLLIADVPARTSTKIVWFSIRI